MFIDSHAHLYSAQFDADRAEMLERARAAGVERVYLPNIDSNSIDAMHALESASEGLCIAMMGLHPCSVKENYRAELDLIRSWLDQRPYAAIGEMGTDLYWDKTTFGWQQDAFIIQMQWAYELSLPLVIHCRESVKETLELVLKHKNLITGGIFHCFSGDADDAAQAIELSYYLGIGGPVTYKKTNLTDLLSKIPLEKIVLETDAPYLPPVPHRGQRNESSYIPLIAQKIAEIKNISIEEVAAVTTSTALKIFNKN